LLGLYAALISWWLRGQETFADVDDRRPSSPRRDLVVVVVVAALALGAIAWFWFGYGPRQLLIALRDRLVHVGVDPVLATKTGNAVVSIGLLLLPAALVTFAAGLGPRQVALIPRRLTLGILLAVISAMVGTVAMIGGLHPAVWQGHGILFLPALFVVQAGVNAIPEEFIFRGVLVSRLVALLRNPGAALVLSSVVFSLFHIPSALSQPGHPPWWLLVPGLLVSPGPQPTGLIWGYLCYRAGSIWPGVLWHASATVFGFIFW
jgi:membrane protease YdiL (CAAX protease family)